MTSKRITANHGAGGRVMQEFIQEVILAKLGNPTLNRLDDAALLENPGGRIAVTTDSFVVQPLRFPGGNIGQLAVCGSVNDLATSGARAIGLSLALIIEEGTPLALLDEIVDSIKTSSQEADVQIVTGDTKVVEQGKGDQVFINTTAFGVVKEGVHLSSHYAQGGDQVYLTGPVGRHEVALMRARGKLPINVDIISDVEALNLKIAKLLSKTNNIHTIKDPTRGGVAGVLNEIASHSKKDIHIQENLFLHDPEVAGVCKLLGLDPLYLASEGRFVIIAPESVEQEIIATFPDAFRVGEVRRSEGKAKVLLSTHSGGLRRIGPLETTQYPRIC